MKKHVSFKKGITLTEICVVLAVVAIVSVMVISFSSLVAGSSGSSKQNLNITEDIILVEYLTKNWLNSSTTNDTITKTENGLLKEGTNYELKFENKTFTYKLGENKQCHKLDYIKNIEFSIVEKNNDALYFCKITYLAPKSGNKKTEKTYTFCVNPFVGEVV